MPDSQIADAAWRKASYSVGEGNCVEVARLGDAVVVRDSKNPAGPTLRFTSAEMAAWIAGCKHGEFDDLV